MTLQEILFIASIAFFVLAFISIVVAVAIFFVRNVPDVRADLSGKKRAEAVARIGDQRPGRDRRKGVARVEPTSGDLTKSERIAQRVPAVVAQKPEASIPARSSSPSVTSGSHDDQPRREVVSSSVHATSASSDASATTVLPDDGVVTTILPDDASKTTVLEEVAVVEKAAAASGIASTEDVRPDDDSQTTILPDDDDATTILPATEPEQERQGESVNLRFNVVRKITLMESDWFIEPQRGANG